MHSLNFSGSYRRNGSLNLSDSHEKPPGLPSFAPPHQREFRITLGLDRWKGATENYNRAIEIILCDKFILD